ncbi:MAG TPA: sodium/glutamate symporter [Methylomirabilota bacterium]
MRTVEFDLISTLLLSMLVLYLGRALVARLSVLKRLNVPAPVVGGVLVAVGLALADGLLHIKLGFSLGLKDSLLLMFFTTVGLAADARMLKKGGPRLLVFLAIGAGLIVVQNLVGISATRMLDLHPVVGLLAGSITLVGGHGTGAAYAGRLGETMNLQGIMELTMACATAGLVIGAVLGGPVAEFLLKRYKLEAAAPAVDDPGHGGPSETHDDAVTAPSLINTLFIVLLCLAIGKILAERIAHTGFILPDFVFSLLLAVVIRNAATLTGVFRVSDATVDVVGNVALSLFLVMALMTMRLLDLVNLAGPLLAILAAQTLLIALFAAVVTFRLMGRNYDAAVMAAGQIGFGMSSTACALAIMKSVTDRHGPSPLAFLIVPMVGAFFIDITNAFIIQAYLALPLFGF